MAQATYRGVDLFGPQVTTDHIPNAVAEQRAAFPGIDGVQRIMLGTRGRTLRVECVLYAVDPAGLRAAEAAIQAYAKDGRAGDFVDESDYTFPNVVFSGEGSFQGPMGFLPDGSVCRKYACTFHGLT